MVFPVPEGISRTQCPPASSVSARGQRLSPRPGSRATHSSSRTCSWDGSRVSKKQRMGPRPCCQQDIRILFCEQLARHLVILGGGAHAWIDSRIWKEDRQITTSILLERCPLRTLRVTYSILNSMMGNLGLPPGVAGGRKAKKGKGKSKEKVRSRVTRTRDQAGFSAQLRPCFLAQYCWFLDSGSIGARLEQPVAFWTRKSSVVATMAVFKVSSLSM